MKTRGETIAYWATVGALLALTIFSLFSYIKWHDGGEEEDVEY